jgi:hypothetical protein
MKTGMNIAFYTFRNAKILITELFILQAPAGVGDKNIFAFSNRLPPARRPKRRLRMEEIIVNGGKV